MPEGPEVKTIAEALHAQLSGKYIGELILGEKSKCNISKLDTALYIHKIVAYGKKVIWVLDNYYLIASLGMTGRFSYKEESHCRIKLIIYNKSANMLLEDHTLYFDDMRCFGNLLFTKDLKCLYDLGPDILEKEMDCKTFIQRFSKQGKKQICQALMEQKVVSGIGNYLKSEILYMARVRPDRLCNTLSEAEWQLICKYSYSIAYESYKAGGLTIATYLAPDGSLGKYKQRVYNRKEDDLGNSITYSKFKDGRGSYYVEALQK